MRDQGYDAFHTDSIWQIQQSSESQNHIITTGKDGKVFMTDVAAGTHQKLYQTSNDEPIMCLAHDDTSRQLWVGTNDSSVQCFNLPAPGEKM